jgi:hypothetical protein
MLAKSCLSVLISETAQLCSTVVLYTLIVTQPDLRLLLFRFLATEEVTVISSYDVSFLTLFFSYRLKQNVKLTQSILLYFSIFSGWSPICL